VTNLELLNYLHVNYHKVLAKFSKQTKSTFIAEECISRFSIKLINKPNDVIESPDAYIYQGLRYQWFNYKRTERKYVTYGEEVTKAMEDTPDPQDLTCDQLDAGRLEFKNREILNSRINALPKKQKLAITNYLKYGNHTTIEGNKNTQKANYLHAIKALRDMS
jgi:DNA-directed RNA polymerase specialized sigma24 family protein